MENWIILNSTTGNSGETQITLQVAENTNYSARTTTLTVRTRSKNLTDTVVINQQAKAESGLTEYLTFEIISGGTIYWKTTGNTHTVEYQINGGSWNSVTSSTGGTPITVSAGDIVKWRGDNSNYNSSSFSGTTAGFKVKNNIMSLIDSDDFASLDSLQSAFTFYYFFQNCTGLTDASKLILPATALTSNCYSSMFNNCTSLTTAPALPATTLSNSCYYNMFAGCTSLSTAPELPATTLSNSCYYGMFWNCTSLTTAPALPATTLANNCYNSMFQGCSNLTTAPVLPATTLTDSCYRSMFRSCTSLTSAPALPATTLVNSCYNSMFSYCSSLTAAPALPATTLANSCYYAMFRNCTSLTTAPALPATTLADSCYYQMFIYCSSLNYIKCLATDISANNCTYWWVSNVAPTGTFVKADSMNDWLIDNINGIPIGWTLINASDEDPDYSTEPLTFEIISGGTIYWKVSTEFAKTIEYQKNNDNWVSIRATTTGVPITVSVNDIIKFRGNNTCYAVNPGYTKYNTFSGTTAEFKVKGNIMSLIDSTNQILKT